MSIYYFAYGSNLASQRLLQRLPNAKIEGVGMLQKHRLSFRKNDQGQSGKCDIELTNNQNDVVYGVLYALTKEEKQTLDLVETLGIGYNEKCVKIKHLDGRNVEAMAYYAIQIDNSSKPYHWYKAHVLNGALEHDFPVQYIEMIESYESIDDSDLERAERESVIYLD